MLTSATVYSKSRTAIKLNNRPRNRNEFWEEILLTKLNCLLLPVKKSLVAAKRSFVVSKLLNQERHLSVKRVGLTLQRAWAVLAKERKF
jgi:hypothetical protein